MTGFMIFLTDNFWLLLLILTMIGMRRHNRLCGMALLGILVIWGPVPWIIFVLTSIAILMEIRYYAIRGVWSDPKKKPQKNDPDYGKR